MKFIMNIRLKTRLVIFSFKKPPKKSFVMKILAPRNPTCPQAMFLHNINI